MTRLQAEEGAVPVGRRGNHFPRATRTGALQAEQETTRNEGLNQIA